LRDDEIWPELSELFSEGHFIMFFIMIQGEKSSLLLSKCSGMEFFTQIKS